MKKQIVFGVLILSLLSFSNSANAYIRDCYTTYTPYGAFRDCNEVYVSNCMMPVAPAPYYPPRMYYPRSYINLNFGGRPGPRPIPPGYHGHHHGGFGASFHISI